MARLTIGQKAHRVLGFLIGLRNPRAIAALAQYGFTENELKEGWTRLQNVTTGRLSFKPIPPRDPSIVVQIDSWENQWFVVADASLRYRYPEEHAWLFLNLGRTEGSEAVVSVGTFLERLRKLPSEPSLKYGQAARTLLDKRGLTSEIAVGAERLIEKLGTAREPQVTGPSAEEQQHAEDQLWAWYREWSTIARAAISDRRLLRAMGFLKKSAPEDVEDDLDELDEPDAAASANPSLGAHA